MARASARAFPDRTVSYTEARAAAGADRLRLRAVDIMMVMSSGERGGTVALGLHERVGESDRPASLRCKVATPGIISDEAEMILCKTCDTVTMSQKAGFCPLMTFSSKISLPGPEAIASGMCRAERTARRGENRSCPSGSEGSGGIVQQPAAQLIVRKSREDFCIR